MLRSVTMTLIPGCLPYITHLQNYSTLFICLIALRVQNVPYHHHVGGLLAHKNFVNVTLIFALEECTQSKSDLWNHITDFGQCHTHFNQ